MSIYVAIIDFVELLNSFTINVRVMAAITFANAVSNMSTSEEDDDDDEGHGQNVTDETSPPSDETSQPSDETSQPSDETSQPSDDSSQADSVGSAEATDEDGEATESESAEIGTLYPEDVDGQTSEVEEGASDVTTSRDVTQMQCRREDAKVFAGDDRRRLILQQIPNSDGYVVGVAKLGDWIYVVYEYSDVVARFSATAPFGGGVDVSVFDMQNADDMAACAFNGALYVAGFSKEPKERTCIWRMKPDGDDYDVIRWRDPAPVDKKGAGTVTLSTTADGRVMLTTWDRFYVYDDLGELLESYSLNFREENPGPSHVIESSRGFLVSRFNSASNLSRYVKRRKPHEDIRCRGREILMLEAKTDVSLAPVHLAADIKGSTRVFVADENSSCILVFDEYTLQLQHDIEIPEGDIGRRLCYIQESNKTRILVVGGEEAVYVVHIPVD